MLQRLRRWIRPDGGAALLITLALTAVVGLMLAVSLAYIRQAESADTYASLHTQALYNARMGVDTALYYLSHDAADIAQANGNRAIQSAVEDALQQLNQPPFQVTLDVSPLTTHHGKTAAAVTVASTGVAGPGAQPVRVTLSVQGTITVVSRGGGGAPGNSEETGTLTVTASQGPNITVSGDPLTVTVKRPSNRKGHGHDDGSGSGQVTITASGTAVTMPSLTSITKSNTTLPVKIHGNAWIRGNHDTIDGSIHGTTVISGVYGEINANLHGETIVSGDDTTLTGRVQGPLLVTANDVTIRGSLHCGAVILGNNVHIDASSIQGPVILAGTQDQVGRTQHPVSLHGGLVLVGDQASVYATVKTGSFGKPFSKTAVISLGQNESLTGTVTGQIAEVAGSLSFHPTGKSHGTPSQHSVTTISATQTVGWKKTCWGPITLSVAPAAANSSGLSHVTLHYGSTAVPG